MKTQTILTALLLSIFSFSFANGPVAVKTASKTFSACCKGNLSLELRADNTFTYVNTMNSYLPINAQGTWYFRDGAIHIVEQASLKGVPSTWRIDRSSGCLIAQVDGADVLQLCDTL